MLNQNNTGISIASKIKKKPHRDSVAIQTIVANPQATNNITTIFG